MKTLKPIKDYVLVSDMNFGERTLSSGLVLVSDDKKSVGIRPRWGKVYAVGPEQKDVIPGQWILVEHGRWTRGVKFELEPEHTITIRRIDANAILLVSDSQPEADDIISSIEH
jgi:co-chaperonin GroES (HSP10)